MRPRLHVKKEDQVYVIAGKDKGKIGKVLTVLPQKQRVIVEKVNMVKRHMRPNPARGITGGILEREAPIHVSNVMVICPECQKPTRVRRQFLQDGRKVRACKKCGGVLDKS